jgi:hypothetical protein
MTQSHTSGTSAIGGLAALDCVDESSIDGRLLAVYTRTTETYVRFKRRDEKGGGPETLYIYGQREGEEAMAA